MNTGEGPMGSYAGPSPWEGIPFRGPQMNLRRDDPPHLQPKQHFEPHVKIFDLSNEDHVKEYLDILYRVTEGASAIGVEDHQFVPEKSNWVCLLRWYDVYMTAPDVKLERRNGKAVWDGKEPS